MNGIAREVSDATGFADILTIEQRKAVKMKTDVILVSSKGSGIDAALTQTEKVAAYKGMTHKDALYLRLLAEEMMSMLGSVAGNVLGKFWIEEDGGVYRLHLLAETDVGADQRKKLISAASSGQKEARRGIMGKLRSFFEPDGDLPVFYDANMSPKGDIIDDTAWSMRTYREEIERCLHERRKGAEDAWDELEKSVVTHVADDVKVSIKGRTVEMTIIRKLA